MRKWTKIQVGRNSTLPPEGEYIYLRQEEHDSYTPLKIHKYDSRFYFTLDFHDWEWSIKDAT